MAAGSDIPNEFNVIIEISANSDPVKYEVDKDTGMLVVDRFMPTAMHYPCDYGYIPQTLSDDGDPVDVLVIAPFPIRAGAALRCRALGVLNMSDEAGQDAKLLAVPVDKLSVQCKDLHEIDDVPEHILKMIEHFFENYKKLESGKWVKIDGWAGREAAESEIVASVQRFEASK